MSQAEENDCYGRRGSNPVAAALVAIFGTTVICIAVTFMINTLCITRTPEQKHKENLKDVKFIKRTAVVAYTCYTVSTLSSWLSLVVCDPQDLTFGFAGIAVTSGMTFVMMVFCIRLYFTFNQTPFALSKKLKYYVIFVVGVIYTGFTGFGILWFAGVISFDIVLPAASFIFIFLISNSILLFFVFINRLNRVINAFLDEFGTVNLTHRQLSRMNKSVSMTSLITDFGDDLADGDKDLFNNMRSLTRLINDMSKYTILISIAIISSFFTAIVMTTLSFNDNTEFLWMQGGLLLDATVNCMCLLLQFEFAKGYYKRICGPLHIKCEDRYTKRANKQHINSTGDDNNIVGFKLERLQTGEIGLSVTTPDASNDTQITQPPLGIPESVSGGIGNNNNITSTNNIGGGGGGASLSIPSTVGIDGKGKNDDKQAAISVSQNAITLIAQKSAEMQLDLKQYDD